MRLSRFTDYAVRVLIYSAMHPARLVTLQELSDFYDISLAHLRKVVHKLGKLGYLKTARGKGGGMRLQRAAQEINIGVVVAELESREPLIDCNEPNCVVLTACGLPRALRRAQAAFYSELEHYTLMDVIRQEKFPLVVENVVRRKQQEKIIACV
jgi:Rrf2 family nitric oxide-sensitive transcriptional repressor